MQLLSLIPAMQTYLCPAAAFAATICLRMSGPLPLLLPPPFILCVGLLHCNLLAVHICLLPYNKCALNKPCGICTKPALHLFSLSQQMVEHRESLIRSSCCRLGVCEYACLSGVECAWCQSDTERACMCLKQKVHVCVTDTGHACVCLIQNMHVCV